MRPEVLVAKRKKIELIESESIQPPFTFNGVTHEIKCHSAINFNGEFEFTEPISYTYAAPVYATTPTMEIEDVRVNLREAIRNAIKEIPIENIVEIFNAENIKLILDQ